jgi:hypothetical protein
MKFEKCNCIWIYEAGISNAEEKPVSYSCIQVKHNIVFRHPVTHFTIIHFRNTVFHVMLVRQS